jgi:hypothetical protein
MVHVIHFMGRCTSFAAYFFTMKYQTTTALQKVAGLGVEVLVTDVPVRGLRRIEKVLL